MFLLFPRGGFLFSVSPLSNEEKEVTSTGLRDLLLISQLRVYSFCTSGPGDQSGREAGEKRKETIEKEARHRVFVLCIIGFVLCNYVFYL